MDEKYWIGTDLKFAFTIKADGFSMEDDDYDLILCCGTKQVQLTKNDIVEGDEEGTYFLLIDTTQFPSGTVRIVARAKVPDDDFDSGVRREVAVKDLCVLRHPW